MSGKIALPAAYDEDILYAARAFFEGKASEEQQKRLANWLVLNVCHIGMLSFGDSERETAFMEGQRSVGLQLVKLREPEALAKIKRNTKPKRQEASE